MAITNFAQLLAEAQKLGPKIIAIAGAGEAEVLQAAQDGEKLKIGSYVLIDDRDLIQGIAEKLKLDLSRMTILHEPDARLGARKAIELVRSGEAHIAMKGRVATGDFLRAALDKEIGLRTGRLFTHVGAFEIPGFDRLILVSDAGVVVAPDIAQKVEIIQNAIYVAQCLGVKEPKVAILAATEMVNPKIPATLDAANLAKMAERGQITDGILDGPLALDSAISPESLQIKGIKSAVAGKADILITPDIEAGNVLVKAISYFANGKMAGVVVGGKVPLIVTSRSDPHETKLMSMALGVLIAS